MAILSGCLAIQLFPALPPPGVFGAVLLVGALLFTRPATRFIGLALLALGCCLIRYEVRLQDRLDGRHARAIVAVSGTVTSAPARYPDLLRFRFAPDEAVARIDLPAAIQVSWYTDAPPELATGQRWHLELSLQPPWGRVNFHGDDPERWLFANGLGARGTVREGHQLATAAALARPAQRVREAVGRAIRERLPDDAAGSGVVQALAIADRSGLDDSTRQLLIDTGTAHLLAISGLHVGLAAAAGFWLLRALSLVLPVLRRGRRTLYAAVAGALLTALAYALLADLGVSTLRAVAMVAVVLMALLTARPIPAALPLAWAAAAVLLIDPFAPLGAGFWFSFTAVAALLFALSSRRGRLAAWRVAIAAQVAVTLALLPISAAWFGQVSALSLPANLVAIPWVSFLVVPPVLAGVGLLPLAGDLAGWLWQFAGQSAAALLLLLETLARHGPRPVDLNDLHPLLLLLALGGGFLLLLPSSLRWKWLAVFLLLPLVVPPAPRGQGDLMVLDVLDVGQGTAALLQAGARRLLYDSGPGDGAGRNLVRPVIGPALGAVAPDRVVISHADLDHAGGLGGLSNRYPGAGLWVNAPDRTAAPCRSGWRWDWAETRIAALHPSPGLPYLGNDSSCVLSVRGPGGGILLAGDVSEAIERRLLAEGLGPHEVLLVPHHGSTSSSSAGFLERVAPRVAIATAALGNRFGFPAGTIRERYRAAGIPLLTTGECGGLRVRLEGGEILSVTSARRDRQRIWRWPAAGHCP